MHNPDHYRHLKEQTIKYFKKKGVTVDKITEYAVFSMIPLTVLYTFIKEELPEHKEFCDEHIERISKLYT